MTNKLSPRLRKLIDKVLAEDPAAIFGGSIALFALGLLQRQPADVDLVGTMAQFKKLKKFQTYYDHKTYPEPRDDEKHYDRRPLNILRSRLDSGKACFFVKSAAKIKFKEVTIDGVNIFVQDPEEVIAAKRNWSHHSKHAEDLKTIDKLLLESHGRRKTKKKTGIR